MARVVFAAALVALVSASHCDFETDSGREYFLECNDGTFQSWITGTPLTSERDCDAYYNFDACTGRGGRKRCPLGLKMCANPTGCASGTDHCCNVNCAEPALSAQEPIFEEETAGDDCNGEAPYAADTVDATGGANRSCDSSSSEKSLLLLLLLLLLLIPLLCCCCLLLLCCLRGKKKGQDVPFATFDGQQASLPPAMPATACLPAPVCGAPFAGAPWGTAMPGY